MALETYLATDAGGWASDSVTTGNPDELDFNGRPIDAHTYWAAVSPADNPKQPGTPSGYDTGQMAANIFSRIDRYYAFMQASGLYERFKRSYLTRYGLSPDGDNVSYRVVRGGDTGALMLFQPNMWANTLTHMATLITSARPDIQAEASNSDADSLRQVSLADQVMQWYQREKKVEDLAREMVELSLMGAEAWCWTRWNADSGDIYMPGQDGGAPAKTGDIDLSIHFAGDIIRDMTALQMRNPEWLCVRHFVNKYDLMAKFPEYADEIMACQKPAIDAFRIEFQTGIGDSDLIPMYQFYHAATDAMPEGRQCTLVDAKYLLLDGPLGYGGKIPVMAMMPARILGTAFGYTPMWDMLSLQQILNALYSGMVTNQVAFAVKRILAPRGQPIKQQQMSANLGVLWYDAALPKPEIWNTQLNTQEILLGIQAIESLFSRFSAISDPQRGIATDQALSGSAMMLLVNQSIQFMSGLQAEYVSFYEDFFDMVLTILKERADAPRYISIAGVTKQTALESFSKQDLLNVRRITAEMANPVMHQFAGKLQMTQMMAQVGAFGEGPQAGQKITEFMRTGNSDVLLDEAADGPLLIRAENELIKRGIIPTVTEYDNHTAHEDPLTGHATVVNDSTARQNQLAMAALKAHLALHAQQRAELAEDAAKEQVLIQEGVQAALPPPPPNALPPGAQQGPGQGNAPPRGGRPGTHPPQVHATGAPPPGNGAAGPNPRMPKMPSMPQGPAGMAPPTTPGG